MNNDKKSKRLLQIAVPIMIVVIIVGIFVIKQNSKPKDAPPTTIDNVDFALHATTLDLEQLKSYGLPIFIDFGADDCEPCKAMAPILKELNQELQGKAIIKFVDVWKNPSLAEGFPVELIPTQFFFDHQGNPYVPSDPEKSKMLMYYHRESDEHVYTAHQGFMGKQEILDAFKEMGLKE